MIMEFRPIFIVPSPDHHAVLFITMSESPSLRLLSPPTRECGAFLVLILLLLQLLLALLRSAEAPGTLHTVFRVGREKW